MSFSINYNNKARKFLKIQEKKLTERIINRIELLKENPFVGDFKAMKGEKSFRMRVGKYRIIYEVDSTMNLVSIIKIGMRGNVYD